MRYILYRPTDNTGFGNRVRGLVGAQALSWATGRVLLVEDDLTNSFFEAPKDHPWRVLDHFRSSKDIPTAVPIPLKLRPDNWDEDLWQSLQTERVDGLAQGDVWWWHESTSFYDALFLNQHYKQVWWTHGASDPRKVSRIGSITQGLLGNPVPEFLESVQEAKRWAGFVTGSIGIQFRSFADSGSRNAANFERFCAEVVSWCRKNSRGRSMFITTDNPTLTGYLTSLLQPLGRVSSFPVEFVNTGAGAVDSSWARRLERLLRLLPESITPRESKMDFKRPVGPWWSKVLRDRIAPMIDWYLLGECSAVLSTFTSYAVFAAARTGNRAELYKIDPASGFVGPPEGENYLF